MNRIDRQPPFAHLNLRRNPFGGLSRRERGRVAVVDCRAETQRLEAGGIVQLVGRKGRGKSTALLALDLRLDEAVYRRLSRDGAVETWPETSILLVDELSCLDRAERLALWRCDAALAVATHEDRADEIRRAERSVETVDLNAPRPIAILEAMFRRRIELQRRGDGPVPTFSDDAIQTLRKRHGSDHRTMQDHLYELFQTLDRPRELEPEDIESVDPPTPERSTARSAHQTEEHER